MRVKKVVIHAINKKGNEQIATVDFSNQLLNIDERATSLIQKLNESYLRTSKS